MSQRSKRAFEREVAASAKALGLHYQKLAVPQRGRVKLCASPYDGFFVVSGRHVPVELKSLTDATCFPFKAVEAHQETALAEMADRGCRPFLLVNFRQERPLPGTKQRGLKAYLLPWEEWANLKHACHPRVSVPRQAFDGKDSFFSPLPRVTVEGVGRVWDLRALLALLEG